MIEAIKRDLDDIRARVVLLLEAASKNAADAQSQYDTTKYNVKTMRRIEQLLGVEHQLKRAVGHIDETRANLEIAAQSEGA
jgi:replicative DNA helicase